MARVRYWELAILKNVIFLSRTFWFFFFQKKKCFFCFIWKKTSSSFIWGIIFFCSMDGFFRILEKRQSELICTRLYVNNNSFTHIVPIHIGVDIISEGVFKKILCSPFQDKTRFLWEHLYKLFCKIYYVKPIPLVLSLDE